MSELKIKSYTLNDIYGRETLAEILGFTIVNNTDSRYAFVKDNNYRGFVFDFATIASGYLRIRDYCSGNWSGNMIYSSNIDPLTLPCTFYYIKTDNYTIISESRSGSPNKLYFGCVKAKDITNDVDTWIWFYVKDNVLYYYSSYSTTIKSINYSGSESANAVSMVPIIIEENEKIIQTDYLFYMLNGKKSTINECFTLDENEYMILSIGEGNTRAVVKLT